MAIGDTAGTAAGPATDSQTDHPTGGDATIGTTVVGETTPETVLVVAEMARLTPIAAGAMTAAIAPVRHSTGPEARRQALSMYVAPISPPARLI